MKPRAEMSGVADYFHRHAEDFDAIYEVDKSLLRRLRDLVRGTVVARLDYVLQQAQQWQPQDVLDVGTGSGRFPIALARQGVPRCVGLDFAADMVRIAQASAARAGVGERCEFHQANFLEWQVPRQFDLSLGIGLFDYVAEPLPLLRRMVRATSGHVVASFPKRLHPLVPLRAWRLGRENCPVFFYARKDAEQLASQVFDDFELFSLGRDWMIVGSTR